MKFWKNKKGEKRRKIFESGIFAFEFPAPHIFTNQNNSIIWRGGIGLRLDWRNSNFDILWNKTGAIKQKPNSSFHTNYVKLLQNCEAGKLIIKVLIIFTDLQFEKLLLIILGSDKMTQGTCPKLT